MPHLLAVHQNVVVKLHELNYELVPHVSYSSDLVPDFFFFPNIKKSRKEKIWLKY